MNASINSDQNKYYKIGDAKNAITKGVKKRLISIKPQRF
jgi:hypothetical protein